MELTARTHIEASVALDLTDDCEQSGPLRVATVTLTDRPFTAA
jgi:hypothetical protein